MQDGREQQFTRLTGAAGRKREEEEEELMEDGGRETEGGRDTILS